MARAASGRARRDAARAVGSAPVARPSAPASSEAITPAAQMTVRARDALASPSPRRCVTAARRCRRRSARQQRHAELLERPLGLAESDGGKAVSTRRPSRRAARAPVPGSIARKSRRSVSRAISAICPAISTPVGPAPTTTKVSQRRALRGVGLELGRLERAQDPAADGERALQRLDLGGVPPLVVAEVRVARAAGDDERVVGERGRRRVADRPQPHLARGEVESGRPRRCTTRTLRRA